LLIAAIFLLLAATGVATGSEGFVGQTGMDIMGSGILGCAVRLKGRPVSDRRRGKRFFCLAELADGDGLTGTVSSGGFSSRCFIEPDTISCLSDLVGPMIAAGVVEYRQRHTPTGSGSAKRALGIRGCMGSFVRGECNAASTVLSPET
jgi:hypothetical protein